MISLIAGWDRPVIRRHGGRKKYSLSRRRNKSKTYVVTTIIEASIRRWKIKLPTTSYLTQPMKIVVKEQAHASWATKNKIQTLICCIFYLYLFSNFDVEAYHLLMAWYSNIKVDLFQVVLRWVVFVSKAYNHVSGQAIQTYIFVQASLGDQGVLLFSRPRRPRDKCFIHETWASNGILCGWHGTRWTIIISTCNSYHLLGQ